MSKELLFRAWTGRQMLYQDNQYLGSFLRRVVMQIMLDNGIDEPWEHESYLPKGKRIDDYLMQYTGTPDQNGRKIYKNDILEAKDYWGEQDYAVVVWNERQLQWYLLRNGALHTPLRTPFADEHMPFEVVGNLHENSDLLEASGNGTR